MGTVTRAPRILFVDDDAAMREAFLRMMRRRGYDVDLATGAAEAIQKASVHAYPVIVADLRMPGMDGLSLVSRLRQTHRFTSFIVVTEVPGLDLERDYGDGGDIISVMAKPWGDDEMAAALDQGVRRHEMRKARAPVSSWPQEGWPERILLVEDNAADADLVLELLSDVMAKGLEVEHVVRLDQALERAHDGSFDFVLSDLSLPDACGLEAVAKLRAAARAVPIVVLSGLDDERIALQALKRGAQDYLVKGEFDRRTLHRSVRHTMERHRAEQRLSTLAHCDQLTGLANRTSFRGRLEHAIARGSRRGETFAIMFLDLDRFKSVNDTLGHEAGDSLLQEVARRLRGTLRATDMVARLGGDEFAVVVDAPSGENEARLAAERILVALEKPILVGDEGLVVTSSIGIAVFPGAGRSADELLKAADSAMYLAKERGRNNWQLAAPRGAADGFRRVRLADALRRGFEQNDFVLHYQPQIELGSQRVVGLEALLRWDRPDEGLVAPAEFIPTLEETGLIIDVGKWVLDNALRQVKEWRKVGGADVRVSVNLSARQFEDASLIRMVQNSLAREDLSPNSLEVEITESLLMRDTEQTKATLSELKELGVRIAIDDFGTGYSSLAYLSRFSVDVLKVDRSFVKNLDTSGSSERQIASAIIALGHNLGLEVVAEGIETAEQLRELRRSGCDIGQGFYLGVPDRGWRPDFARPNGRACNGWAAA